MVNSVWKYFTVTHKWWVTTITWVYRKSISIHISPFRSHRNKEKKTFFFHPKNEHLKGITNEKGDWNRENIWNIFFHYFLRFYLLLTSLFCCCTAVSCGKIFFIQLITCHFYSMHDFYSKYFFSFHLFPFLCSSLFFTVVSTNSVSILHSFYAFSLFFWFIFTQPFVVYTFYIYTNTHSSVNLSVSPVVASSYTCSTT